MNSFYKNIALYDSLNFDMDMGKSEFIEDLKKITYKTNTTFISFIPDHGIPTRYEYRGIVNNNGFIVKRRLHLFDLRVIHCIIKGNFTEENDMTLIKIEFTPFILHFLALIFISLFVLTIGILMIINENNYFIIIIPFSIIASQYFILKRCIERDKYDFIRELNFITQKK